MRQRITALGLAALLLSAAAAAAADPPARTFRGRAVTGINRILGRPFFDLGAPYGTIGFDTVAAYNPHGTSPLPLTPASGRATLLATTVDPAFLAVFGVSPASFDPAKENVPLRDIGVITGVDGSRQPLGDLLVSSQLAPARAPSTGPITLGDWLAARGTARVRCSRGAGRIDLEFEGLIPHGLYTAWGGMLTAQGPAPIALGGVPNAFLADEEGEASYTARLNYCPLALRPGETPLAFIDIVLHSDHALYAAVPEEFAAGFPPGLVTQIHVEFAIGAIPVL